MPSRLFIAAAAAFTVALCPAPASSLSGTGGGDASESRIYPELTSDVLFRILSAEIALQRNQGAAACEVFLDTAKKTSSPALARRAFEILNAAGRMEDAEKALALWEKLETPAGKSLPGAFALIRKGSFDEALPVIAKYVKDGENPAARLDQAFASVNSKDHEAAYRFMASVGRPYEKDLPALGLFLGRAALEAGNGQNALRHLLGAAESSGREPNVVRQAAALAARVDRKAASDMLLSYIKDHPGDYDMRIFRAAVLASAKEEVASRNEILSLAAETLSPEQTMKLAALAESAGMNGKARELYLRYAKDAAGTPNADLDRAYSRLGAVCEKLGRREEALSFYARVEKGAAYTAVKLRESAIYSATNRLDQAVDVLLRAKPEQAKEQMAVTATLASLYNRQGKKDEAYRVLKESAAKFENEADLLYETAMQAERVGDMQGVEFHLRKFIALRPDSAEGYNALGYIFADRGINLREALRLVKKADSLKPGDPHILDSLGWTHYRLGNDSKAARYLKKALDAGYSGESLEHLLEVLMKMGERDEASKVLEEWAAKMPQDKKIPEIRKRLGIP